jgi:hypothetical protein
MTGTFEKPGLGKHSDSRNLRQAGPQAASEKP